MFFEIVGILDIFCSTLHFILFLHKFQFLVNALPNRIWQVIINRKYIICPFFAKPSFHMVFAYISIFCLCPPYGIMTSPYEPKNIFLEWVPRKLFHSEKKCAQSIQNTLFKSFRGTPIFGISYDGYKIDTPICVFLILESFLNLKKSLFQTPGTSRNKFFIVLGSMRTESQPSTSMF